MNHGMTFFRMKLLTTTRCRRVCALWKVEVFALFQSRMPWLSVCIGRSRPGLAEPEKWPVGARRA